MDSLDRKQEAFEERMMYRIDEFETKQKEVFEKELKEQEKEVQSAQEAKVKEEAYKRVSDPNNWIVIKSTTIVDHLKRCVALASEMKVISNNLIVVHKNDYTFERFAHRLNIFSNQLTSIVQILGGQIDADNKKLNDIDRRKIYDEKKRSARKGGKKRSKQNKRRK